MDFEVKSVYLAVEAHWFDLHQLFRVFKTGSITFFSSKSHFTRVLSPPPSFLLMRNRLHITMPFLLEDNLGSLLLFDEGLDRRVGWLSARDRGRFGARLESFTRLGTHMGAILVSCFSFY